MELKPWITFQEKLEYQFKFPAFLEEALTHKSFAFERTGKATSIYNERLEFLGDAMLGLSMSRILMLRDQTATEGDLSKRRASLVNEVTLADVARDIGLSDYIILGRGEVTTHGTQKNSILASTLEAIFGAVFLDGGFEPASSLIERLFSSRIEQHLVQIPFQRDYKTRLQEKIQGLYKATPQYRVESTQGPDHEKTFHVAVLLGDKTMGQGSGRSRKEAEQEAARLALEVNP